MCDLRSKMGIVRNYKSLKQNYLKENNTFNNIEIQFFNFYWKHFSNTILILTCNIIINIITNIITKH